MKYVGVCFDSGTWGGDLTGLLVAELPEGWTITARHVSSSESWAESDIRYHYDRRETQSDGDSFEWLGQMTVPEIAARFGWVGAVS